ncbi:hypothetical protein ABFS82_02G137800 [Erythranthe guttata]
MSHNQSRAERSESTQYKKTGRSGSFNQRQFSGSVPTKGGGGASSAATNPSSRSFKKNNNNAPVGQPGARSTVVDSSNSPAPHAVQNGAHQQQPPTYISGTPTISTSSGVKPTDTSTHSISRAVPRAPSSNVSSAPAPSNISTTSSEPKPPTTPGKAPGDASKPVPLQFGSISPGFMNGVQIPARTSSAPPNLDEQKKDQARHESLRAAVAKPVPSIPNQQFPKKDAGILDQPKAGETQLVSKPKRDAQISSATHHQSPSRHPIPGMPMQLPYHQPQVPVQFGGQNLQIQPQAMPGPPMQMQMPMSLPIGNLPVQHPMYVPGLQPHHMQPQGMMHQGQSLTFPPQMGAPHPSQLGSMGMSLPPQFQQQPAVKYGGTRKTVKITHPDTHEELRLESSPAPRLHPNISMQFYPGSYNPASGYLPAGSSVHLNSTQVQPTSQPPRVNQVTVKPPVGSRGEKELLPPTGSLSVGKAELSKPSRSGEGSVIPLKEIEPSSLSTSPKPKPGLGTSYATVASSSPVVVDRVVSRTSVSASDPMDGSASASTTAAEEARSAVVKSDSIKDEHKKSGNDQQDQVGMPQTSLSSLPSQIPEPEAVEVKSISSRNNLVSENVEGPSSTTAAAFSEASNSTSEGAGEGRTAENLKSVGMEVVNCRQSKPDTIGSLETSLKSLSLESPKVTGKMVESSDHELTSTTGVLSEHTPDELEESLGCCSNDAKMDGNLAVPTLTSGGQSTKSSDASLSVPDSLETSLRSVSVETTVAKYDQVDQKSAPVLVSYPSEDVLPSTVNGKAVSDVNVGKTVAQRGKKKKKELFKKAEAAGASSDLYMAYKGPEENKETVMSSQGSDNSSSVSEKEKAMPCEKPAQIKVEPDDWEDAAEISTPQLETSKNEIQDKDGDGYELTIKRYSRDFLLKFLELCTNLPEEFEIASDIADALMVSSVNVPRESYPSPGRNTDRPVGGSRPDRRASGLVDEDKWNKFPAHIMSGRGDMRTDVNYMHNIVGVRHVQGVNHAVLRNPRPQPSVYYVGPILTGPMQLGPQGGQLQRNNSESDRWLRGTGFQKGLMPNYQTPMQVIHKAEKKYEIGKVTDEEQAKQRQLKGILNKLTPQNFEKLFEQVKQVNIDNVITLSGVISQIFDKALMEPTFCEMYANFCFHLAADLPDLSVDNEKITFKRLLLNKCQEEFERGEREEEEANKAEEEGEVKQTAEEREEKRLQVRRRMLGNIRLIGELYKKRMLTERIMHECINKLLGQYHNPDEENIEALCKLMSTIGEMIDHPKAKEFMDAYFDIMAQLSNNMKLSSRVRFMLKDSIDLRKNKWQQRRKVEGPKKIDEVHRDAAQERHAQASRLARVPSMGNSARRGQPMDFASRSSNMLSPPSPQIGGFRGVPPQSRGYGSQDARTDERHSSENRTMSVPMPQRPPGDETITLGPQGGLARGMAFRGYPSAPSSIPFVEMPSSGDARRVGLGQNSFSSMSERAAYGPEVIVAAPIYDQSHPQERNDTYVNREVRNMDHSSDRAVPVSSHARGGPPTSTQNASSDKVWTDELQAKSLATIKEFYSARDEHEVALCMKEFDTPSFYPSMISAWVNDSFERKDMERDLLTKLLINLTKPGQGMITESQLIKGFGSVLAGLEDMVNDAPKAAEFLGRIFAKVILEKIVSLSEIGQLIYEGGEEQGQLVQIGLAGDVLGSVLDIIQSEKGESVLNEIRSSSNLRLEDFRPPPGSKKSPKIDKFI